MIYDSNTKYGTFYEIDEMEYLLALIGGYDNWVMSKPPHLGGFDMTQLSYPSMEFGHFSAPGHCYAPRMIYTSAGFPEVCRPSLGH